MLKLVRGLNHETESFVGCPDADVLTDEFAELVGADHMLTLPKRAFRLGPLRDMMTFVRKNKIDIIHSHGKGAGLYARAASRLTGIPAVHTFHGLHYLHYGPVTRLGYRLFERLLSALSSRLIAVVDSEKDVAVRQGFAPPDKITVIRTGLEHPPELAAWPIGGPVKVIHFSRFDVQKNFDGMLALASAAAAASLDGKLQFVVIGNGPRRDEYQALAKERSVGNFFEFLGYVPDAREAMRDCRALVSTSRWEGLPVAPLEAGEAGLFLALSRIPGHEELALSPDGTMLFDTDKVEDHDRVVRWLASLNSAYEGHVAQRQALLNAFSFDDMLAGHTNLYKQIAATDNRFKRSDSSDETPLHSTPAR